MHHLGWLVARSPLAEPRLTGGSTSPPDRGEDGRDERDRVAATGFEGVSTVRVGVPARPPFRAFVLGGPRSGSRLVVDVGHRW